MTTVPEIPITEDISGVEIEIREMEDKIEAEEIFVTVEWY